MEADLVNGEFEITDVNVGYINVPNQQVQQKQLVHSQPVQLELDEDEARLAALMAWHQIISHIIS